MSLKLGKKPPVYTPGLLQFANYRLSDTPIKVPSSFGHAAMFQDWGMLGNDQWGDCVFAGSDHEVMMINTLASGGVHGLSAVSFTNENALADYGAVTGFDPNAGPPGNNPTDQGTLVTDALNYRKSVGVVDDAGRRHKIGAYVALEPKNIAQLIEALWIFEVVAIGFEFPNSAMDQYGAGKPWSVVPGAQIEGGHYVPIMGIPFPGMFACITWGKRQLVTDAFVTKYNDEAYAYITTEELNARTQSNFAGYNWAQLQADLQHLPPTV